LEAWKLEPPLNVRVMPDGVKYDNEKGEPKEANLRSLQKAINGMVIKEPITGDPMP